MKLKTLLLFIICSATLSVNQAWSEGITLQEIVGYHDPLPTAIIYVAKETMTLDPNQPEDKAVAVVGDRILAVGSLEQLKAVAGDQPYQFLSMEYMLISSWSYHAYP